jgi:hypothetical protein
MLIYFNAGNDTNGNPRRCFVYFSATNNPLYVWDEGYYGRDCLPGDMRSRGDEISAHPVAITVKQYNQFLKLPSPSYSSEVL